MQECFFSGKVVSSGSHMSILIIALSTLSLLAWIIGHNGVSIVIALLTFILFVISVEGILPSLLYSKLKVNAAVLPDSYGCNNVLIVHGIDTVLTEAGSGELSFYSYARLIKARDIYNECIRLNLNCRVLITGGVVARDHPNESVLMQEQLERLGIPTEAIIADDQSANTWENAKNSSAKLGNTKHQTVLVLSSNLHIRRFQEYLSHFGVKSIPIPTDNLYPKLSIVPGRLNYLITDVLVHELIGLARYRYLSFMGLNNK